MGVLSEVNENPSLLPSNEADERLEDIVQDENQEPIPESNLKGISPEQQGGAILGSDSLPATDTQVLPDLTDKAVQEQMAADQQIWWDMERGDERTAARTAWIEKYWGSKKAYADSKSLYGTSNPLEHLNNIIEPMAAFGMGFPEAVSNVVGMLPGLAGVDAAYDRLMEKIFTNPNSKAVREVGSIVLPSIVSGSATTALVQKMGYAHKLNKVQQLAIGLSANSILDSAIVGVSDQGLEDNYFQKMYESNFMGIFGKEQALQIPEILRTMDGDSVFMRRWKNSIADLPWSVVGNIIGWGMAFKATPDGAPVIGWMEPLDETATAYKNSRILSVAESDDIKRMEELNDQLASGTLKGSAEADAIDELILLEERTGTLKDIDDALRIDDDLVKTETDLAAERKIANNGGEVPTDFDPDITPGVIDNTRQPPIIGNVARNMADQAAIRSGRSVGDPNPIITEAAMRGLGVDEPFRKVVAGIASEKTGRFNALIDGFKYTNDEMRAASWANYAEIVDPNSTVADLRELFADGRDIKNIFMGKLQVEYISDEKFKGAMLALRDLLDVYMGKPVTETSANVMTTLGAEIRTASESLEQYKGIIDEDAVLERVIDKIQYLLDETALAKYISGWSLQNKNLINEVPLENIESAAKTILNGFNREATSIHQKNLRFVNTLRKAKEVRPEVLKPLAAAFVLSDGKVDTLNKLLKFAAEEVSPLTLLKSPDPRKMSLFSKSLFSLVFSNVLSLRSISKAVQSGIVQQVIAPMNSIQGALVWGLVKGDLPDQLRRTFYAYSSFNHVNKKSFQYAWNRLKAVHKDPTAMMRAARKDFMFKSLKEREIVDEVRNIWKKDGNWGRVYQYDIIRAEHAIASMDWARYPMTGMTVPDAYTQMTQAHKIARIRAWSDVMDEYGHIVDETTLRKVEIKYRNMFFNGDKMLTDKLVQNVSDDINFTGDDQLSSYLTEATTRFPFLRFAFMFPRTESNAVKNAFSYTPIVGIPGATKHSKILYAGDDPIKIGEALAEHGVEAATDPHARGIYEWLRNEYTGRLMTSAWITKLGWDYAMSGGIMGPGHHNPAIRAYEQRTFNLQYKTIRVPGTNTRISYEGIPIIDPVLSILGNMVYYSKDLDGPMMEDINAKVLTTLLMGFGDNKLESLSVLADMFSGDGNAAIRFIKRAAQATFVPAEVRQLTRAIDGALRDVNDNLLDFVKAQNPITVSLVPKKLDGLTGNPVFDQENGFVRTMNELSGIRFSQDSRFDPDLDKPFPIDLGDGQIRQLTTRDAIRILQYRGFRKFEKNSIGSVKLTSRQREDLIEFVHAEKDANGGSVFFNKVREIVSSQKYHDHFAILRQHQANNVIKQAPDLEISAGKFPMFLELDNLIEEYIKDWELQAGLEDLTEAQKEINFELEEGNINDAIEIQGQNTEKQKLLQYGGTR